MYIIYMYKYVYVYVYIACQNIFVYTCIYICVCVCVVTLLGVERVIIGEQYGNGSCWVAIRGFCWTLHSVT